MSMRNKLLITIACLSVILCSLIAGSIAWLTDQTKPVVNKFKPSTINITLSETERDYKMVPGQTIAKDPTITVAANSEACYVFVKIEEKLGAWKDLGLTFKQCIDYTIAAGWTPLDGVAGVYHRVVEAVGTESQSLSVIGYNLALADGATTFVANEILVQNTVTKDMMDKLYKDGSINTEVLPTLTFTAYACQKEGFSDAKAAWEVVKPQSGNG